MAQAPKGYKNLDTKVGNFALYYHTESGQVALLLADPLDTRRVGENEMKRFATKGEAEAWVKSTFESAPVQAGVLAYNHSQETLEMVEVRWNVLDQQWYGIHNGGFSGRKYRQDDLFTPEPTWVASLQLLKEDIRTLEKTLRQKRNEWHEAIGAGIVLEPQVLPGNVPTRME